MEVPSDTIRFAKHYCQQGLWPIPIPPREKGPRIAGWQKLRLAEDEIEKYFRPGDNIGIILGAPRGLVDIDLDCAEALGLADKYLPPTGWIFGRAGKLRSHRIYRCKDDAIPTKRFVDPMTGGVIVELRGDGGQTIFPPSVHPGGENISFEKCERGLVSVEYGASLSAVRKLAARCLAVRYGDGSAADDEDTWLPAIAKAPEKVQDAVLEWLGKPRPANEPGPASARPNGPSGLDRAYAEVALRDECAAVSSAGEGSRNVRLNEAALKLGHLAAGGLLGEAEVRAGLEDAARQCGLPLREARATIESGLRAGMREPRGRPDGDGQSQKSFDSRDRGRGFSQNNAPWCQWREPKPIIAELKSVPAFDAGTLLPDVLRAWIMDEAERMPCPPDFIAAAALVALGSIIGARCAIKPKARDSWLIVPNLWGGIVGDPSAKKSPAWGVALKPLDRLIATALEAHTAAQADYETEKVVFNAHKDAIEGRIKEAAKKPSKGDPASIAKELRTHGEQAPEAPTLRRYKTNDSTVEKLGELLRENPAGLLVLRDELVGLIATWEREGREGERAFFLEAWNGNQSFDTDRIGRGHISIPNLCASIFGGIQPDKLTVYLEQAAHALANDGMLQRFQLLVYPDARRWEWRDRSPHKAARERAFAVFEALADFDPVAWGAAPVDDFAKFPHFCFDDEAQAVFIEWSEDMHCGRMPNEDEPIIRQHLAKFDKLFPALALIFHLVDCAAQGISGPVTKEAALRAGAWCEYLEAHARRCYGLLKDDGLRAAQALAAKLERGALEDGFTLRDVRRNQWRSLIKRTISTAFSTVNFSCRAGVSKSRFPACATRF